MPTINARSKLCATIAEGSATLNDSVRQPQSSARYRTPSLFLSPLAVVQSNAARPPVHRQEGAALHHADSARLFVLAAAGEEASVGEVVSAAVAAVDLRPGRRKKKASCLCSLTTRSILEMGVHRPALPW